MRRKKQPVSLPAEGVAFAVPLEDDRFGACRVIRGSTGDEAKAHGTYHILVACSAWIGESIPDAQDPALRPILYLTHHSWDNKPEILWISDPVPDDFIPIGTIESTAEEKEIQCLTFGGWGSVRVQPLAQWRWDNDRESVLAGDTIQNKESSLQHQRERQERAEYLAHVTLEQLRDRQFFRTWDDYPPRKAIRASRHIMADTVQQLLDLGSSAPEADRMAILQDCIERFNAIDAEMDYFIETVEREDICEEFEAIVHACGLGGHGNLVDEWRDW
jgi:hypothetical protein